jgi:AcrR family transcriptional regulator
MTKRRTKQISEGDSPPASPRTDASPIAVNLEEPVGQSRRSARRDLVETAILTHAAALFADKGYAGTTPQQIADSVGMSRQSLYYYISSKEDLLAKLVAHMTTDLVEQMRLITLDEDLSAIDKLSQVVKLIVTDRATKPREFRLLDRSSSSLPEELTKEYLIGRREALAIVRSVICQGIAEGHFKPVDERVAALSVIGMCNWVAWWFEPADGHPVAPVAEQISDSAVSMLRSVAGPPKGPETPLDLVRRLESDISELRRSLTD